MNNASQLKIYIDHPHWLAVEKPSGLFTHPTDLDRQAPDLLSQLQKQTQQSLAPLNRLDRATSGLIIFTKGAAATKTMQQQWTLPSTVKTYLCLARGKSADHFRSDRALTDHRTKTLKEASSVFEKVADYPRCSLLKAKILSGRTHQIRRHLAHLGHHLLGDTTYGKGRINLWARERGLERLFLHCHQLEFEDPFSQEKVLLTSPLPTQLASFLKVIEAEAQ